MFVINIVCFIFVFVKNIQHGLFANRSFVKPRCYDIYILSTLPPVFSLPNEVWPGFRVCRLSANCLKLWPYKIKVQYNGSAQCTADKN